jgi:hypothetical protein
MQVGVHDQRGYRRPALWPAISAFACVGCRWPRTDVLRTLCGLRSSLGSSQAQDELVEARNRLARAIAGAAMSSMTRDEIVDLTPYTADRILRIGTDAGSSGGWSRRSTSKSRMPQRGHTFVLQPVWLEHERGACGVSDWPAAPAARWIAALLMVRSGPVSRPCPASCSGLVGRRRPARSRTGPPVRRYCPPRACPG